MNAMYHAMHKAGLVDDEAQANDYLAEQVRVLEARPAGGAA